MTTPYIYIFCVHLGGAWRILISSKVKRDTARRRLLQVISECRILESDSSRAKVIACQLVAKLSAWEAVIGYKSGRYIPLPRMILRRLVRSVGLGKSEGVRAAAVLVVNDLRVGPAVNLDRGVVLILDGITTVPRSGDIFELVVLNPYHYVFEFMPVSTTDRGVFVLGVFLHVVII